MAKLGDGLSLDRWQTGEMGGEVERWVAKFRDGLSLDRWQTGEMGGEVGRWA